MNEKEAFDIILERSFGQLEITLLNFKKSPEDSIEARVLVLLFAGVFQPLLDIKEYILENAPTSFRDRYITYEKIYHSMSNFIDNEIKDFSGKKNTVNES